MFRTTWQLARGEADGVVTVGIAAVTRHGPLVEITTPGQVQAGTLTRVQITGAVDLFPLASAALEEPATGAVQTLRSSADSFHGAFVASRPAAPQPLMIRLHRHDGQELVVPHHYGVRGAGEGVVQRVAETETTRFFAVTVAADGTVWAGGDEGARLYRVAAGDTSATLRGLTPPRPIRTAMAASISSMSSQPTLRKPRTAMAIGRATTPTQMTITTDLPMPKKPRPRPRPMREIRYRFRCGPPHRG